MQVGQTVLFALKFCSYMVNGLAFCVRNTMLSTNVCEQLRSSDDGQQVIHEIEFYLFEVKNAFLDPRVSKAVMANAEKLLDKVSQYKNKVVPHRVDIR